MSTTASDSRPSSLQFDDSIKGSLKSLETLLDQASDHVFDAEYFEKLERELKRLHARFRTHHAEDRFAEDDNEASVAPELAEEVKRLRGEHAIIIGQLDRLIRCAESMVDRTLEDKDVFVLRGRELIALLRRHEAEEDRLFYLSVWRDTGGES